MKTAMLAVGVTLAAGALVGWRWRRTRAAV